MTYIISEQLKMDILAQAGIGETIEGTPMLL
jgi:hypothetical protein